MSKLALAGYIKRYREHKALVQEDLAQMVGVRGLQIWRWEKGEATPRVELLARLLEVVGGSAATAHKLLLDADATEQDGERMAEQEIESGASL